nr:hypothetical protein Iba_chr06fCG4350 [Ipomoea batatas]
MIFTQTRPCDELEEGEDDASHHAIYALGDTRATMAVRVRLTGEVHFLQLFECFDCFRDHDVLPFAHREKNGFLPLRKEHLVLSKRRKNNDASGGNLIWAKTPAKLGCPGLENESFEGETESEEDGEESKAVHFGL